MKKLGFIIAFCSFFALGLSAQTPNIKNKTAKTPVAAPAKQGVDKKKPTDKKVASQPRRLPVQRKAVRPAQPKMRAVEKPKQE